MTGSNTERQTVWKTKRLKDESVIDVRFQAGEYWNISDKMLNSKRVTMPEVEMLNV